MTRGGADLELKVYNAAGSLTTMQTLAGAPGWTCAGGARTPRRP
jgi:hypothetical protein